MAGVFGSHPVKEKQALILSYLKDGIDAEKLKEYRNKGIGG